MNTQMWPFLLCLLTKFLHICTNCAYLHWLLVWSRLYFKIHLITNEAVAFQQLPSLWNLLKVRYSSRSLLYPGHFLPFAQGFGTQAYANYAPKCGMYFPTIQYPGVGLWLLRLNCLFFPCLAANQIILFILSIAKYGK